MSFQIPIVHLPRSITFASYIAFSASKGYLTLTMSPSKKKVVKSITPGTQLQDHLESGAVALRGQAPC